MHGAGCASFILKKNQVAPSALSHFVIALHSNAYYAVAYLKLKTARMPTASPNNSKLVYPLESVSEIQSIKETTANASDCKQVSRIITT
jgi:hypothetical protein